ncbi:hypothetical protein ACFCY8_11335 [Streptomyces noursei]|uniref:hypothetical protein n=1 Tax=Streptomyces noursei TaxID=1971 RepID=UPI0035DF2EA6
MASLHHPRKALPTTANRCCAQCEKTLGRAAVGYLVEGIARPTGRRRRWQPARALICHTCYRAGAAHPRSGLTRPQDARRGRNFEWFALVGRGAPLPPTPCAGCGIKTVRGQEPALRRVTCSAACRTALTRVRRGGNGSGRPCPVCGRPVTTGRADTLYDRATCRQKAYRTRRQDNDTHTQP